MENKRNIITTSARAEFKSKHKSPSRTLQAQCHYCVQSRSDADVEDCTGDFVLATGKPCPFYEYRMGKKRPSVKILRKYCLECMGGSKEAVKECETEDCLIYSYRFGKNPLLGGKGRTAAQMASMRANRQAVSKGKPVYFERSDSKQQEGMADGI